MHLKKSKLLIILCIYILLFETVWTDKILCPSQCICDLVDNDRRVSCEGRNLLDVMTVPKEVNIFSLRGNVIKKLDNNCFIKKNSREVYYTSLKELDLSENSISDMDMYAFRGLDHLENLNLSRNRIEMIYQYLFMYNNLLEVLDLSYNNFLMLKDGIFIYHKKLKILNLSYTQIVQLHNNTFSELPGLEVLNLNGNNMIRLQISVLEIMPRLKIILLNDNKWHCNADFENVQKWLLDNRIVSDRQCKTNKKSEKMVVKQTSTEDFRSEEDLRVLWNLDKDEEDKDTNQKSHNPKISNTSITCFKNPETFIELFNQNFPSSWSLIIGLQVGILIGMMVTYFWLSGVCSCRKWKRRSSHNHGPSRNRNNFLLSNAPTTYTDTPPLLRRELFGLESFPRSNSWESGSINRPSFQRNRLVLQDVNEMQPIQRTRAETPPPPYADCTAETERTDTQFYENINIVAP